MAKYLYGYHEERGFADLYVTDRDGKTVWEAHYPSFYESNGEMLEETTIFEDGFMKDASDLEGLESYLKSISVINKGDELVDVDSDDDDEDEDDEEYAAGGTIEAKIKKRLKNAFELPIQIAVYVPSTRDKDIIITKREMEARVDEVERFLANSFGGFSAVKVEGGFESSDKGLIQEDAVRVVAFASNENENGIPFEQSFESLMNQVKNWCSKWSQQSIGVEFENDLFYVDTETKFADGGEVEDEVYNAYVVWIDDNDEAFFDGGWWSIEDAEDRVSDIEWEEEGKTKYVVFAVEYDEDYFENKNWDITRMKSYRPYGSTSYKRGGTTEDVQLNDIVWFREETENHIIWAKNTVYAWLYDDPKAAEKLRSGEYDHVLFPIGGGIGLYSQKGFVAPLQRIWTKKYQNKTKGSDRLIGIVQGWYDEENKKLYIDMMTTRKDMRRKGVNSHIIRELRKELGLEREQVEFVNTTQDGEKFSKSSKYEDGGDIAEGNLQMLRSNAKAVKHHAEELEGELNDDTEVEAWVVAKGERAATDLSDITHYLDGKQFSLGGMTAGRWYKDNSGEEFKFIGKIDSGVNKGRFLFSDGQKSVYKDLEDFEGGRPKETKLFGFFGHGGDIEHGVDLFEDYEAMPVKVLKILGKYDLESGDYRELEKALKDLNSIGYTFEYELDGEPYDLRKIGQKGKSEFYAKGGSIKSLEKRVAEVNELIKRGNDLGIEVVDEGNTWQAPMKYKPLKYTNGVLYVSYEQMDLYKYSKEYVKEWEKKSYKVGKYDNSYGFKGEAGSMQREVLTDIARMYRKPLKSYDTYGYFEDGGEVNKVNPEEMKAKIEDILNKVVPSFYKGVSIYKNIFDTGNNIRIFIAASDYKINGVSGQLPQVVSLSLDLSDMDLHPQVFGGNGGRAISRKPNMSDPDEKYLAAKSVKVPFRTPQPNEKAVLDAIKRFADNYKKTLAENKDVLLYQDIVDYDKLLANSQYADGGKVDFWGDIDVYARKQYEPIGIYSDKEKEVSAFKYGFIWGKSQKKYDRDLAENEGIKKYKPVGFRNVDRKQAVAFWEGARFAHSEQGKKMADGGMVSEKEMRETYVKAFGKEYDDKSRKQHPLPLNLAYQVALQKLKREGKMSDGGMMEKGGVIASSETKEGIEKLISDYYYSSNISLKKVDNKDEYEVSNSKGKINGVKVVVKRGRYQFINSDKMAKGGEVMKHKHLEHVTIELLEPTSKGWKVKQIETHSIGGRKLSTPKEKVAYFSKEEIKDLFEPTMAMGGTFASGVKAIEKRLVGTKVKPKYQKDYGKTYDKAEAHEAASKIKGKIRAMELAKKYKKKK